MSRKMKLDFTGVESFQRASEGVHTCKIVSADEKPSSNGNDMIVVAFEVTKGEDKGSRVFENYPLIDTALWKLKGLLQAIGMKADGKVQLDLDKLIGKTLSVTVTHEEYNGSIRARVDSVNKISASEDADDEDEDEEDEIEEEQEEKPVKKSKATSKKPAMNPPEEDDEDDEDDEDWDEDDDEEEEEKPAPKTKKASKPEKKKAPEKKSAKKSKSDEDEDDEDWDDDDWDE